MNFSVQNETSLSLSLCSSTCSATVLAFRETSGTLSRNSFLFTHLVLPVPVYAFSAVPCATALVSRCLSVCGVTYLRHVHASLSTGCSPGCHRSSLTFIEARMIQWTSCVARAASSRNLYLSYQLFRRDSASCKLASQVTTLTGANCSIPLIALSCLFMRLWYSSYHIF